MSIQGKSIYLRAMEKTDMKMYREMINDQNIANMVVGWSFPVSDYQQNEWFERASGDVNKRFTICLKSNNKAVGMVTLSDIDWVNRSAFHGIKLHSDCPKNAGIGTDAIMALMEYAFNQLNLHRLNGEWFLYNTSSKKMYEKCGWREEGIKKEAVYRNGEYHDLAITGILKDDYLKAKERLGW